MHEEAPNYAALQRALLGTERSEPPTGIDGTEDVIDISGDTIDGIAPEGGR